MQWENRITGGWENNTFWKRPDNGWVMTLLILYLENFKHYCCDLYWGVREAIYLRVALLSSNGTNFEGNESCGGWRWWYFQTSNGRELEECPTCTDFAFSWLWKQCLQYFNTKTSIYGMPLDQKISIWCCLR